VSGHAQLTPDRSGEVLWRSQSRASFERFQKLMSRDAPVSEATTRHEAGSVIPIVDWGCDSGQFAESVLGGVLATLGGLLVVVGALAVGGGLLAAVLVDEVFEPLQPERRGGRAAASRTRIRRVGRLIARPE
jgi:hypothetical protein